MYSKAYYHLIQEWSYSQLKLLLVHESLFNLTSTCIFINLQKNRGVINKVTPFNLMK